MGYGSRTLLVLYLSVSNALYEYRSIPAQPLSELSFLPLSEGLDNSLPMKANRSLSTRKQVHSPLYCRLCGFGGEGYHQTSP